MLETYVIAYKFFIEEVPIDTVFVAATCVGLISLSFGIATAYTCEENIYVKLAVAAYFGAMSVARFSVHVALGIDVGFTWTFIPVIFCFWIRVGFTYVRYREYFMKHLLHKTNHPVTVRQDGEDSLFLLCNDFFLACGLTSSDTAEYTSDAAIFTFTVGLVDAFLTYFFPIGTDPKEQGRLENDRMKVVLAISGPLEKATVDDKILSWPALKMLFTHLIEIFVGWIIVLSYSSSHDVELWYAMVWGILPIGVAMVLLTYLYWLSERRKEGAEGATTAAVHPSPPSEPS